MAGCTAAAKVEEEEVLFVLSLSLELKPGRTGTPKEDKSRCSCIATLMCINIGVLNRSLASLTAGL